MDIFRAAAFLVDNVPASASPLDIIPAPYEYFPRYSTSSLWDRVLPASHLMLGVLAAEFYMDSILAVGSLRDSALVATLFTDIAVAAIFLIPAYSILVVTSPPPVVYNYVPTTYNITPR